MIYLFLLSFKILYEKGGYSLLLMAVDVYNNILGVHNPVDQIFIHKSDRAELLSVIRLQIPAFSGVKFDHPDIAFPVALLNNPCRMRAFIRYHKILRPDVSVNHTVFSRLNINTV